MFARWYATFTLQMAHISINIEIKKKCRYYTQKQNKPEPNECMTYLLLCQTILHSTLKIVVKFVSVNASNHLNGLGKGFNCSLDWVKYILVKCFISMNKGIIYIYVWGKVLEQFRLTRLGKIEILSSMTRKAIYLFVLRENSILEKKSKCIFLLKKSNP